MSWDIIARALFVDNGAAAGLAKLNTQIHDVTKAAPGGARGLRAFETGLQSLAFQAAGVEGPVGRVAEGLLRFSGGSTLVLGAAAGIGLIAEAYNLAAAKGKELADANEKAAESWRNMVARGKPLVALQNELSKAIKDRADAEDELIRLSAQSPEGTIKGTAGEIAQAQALVTQRANNVALLRQQLHQAAIGIEAEASQAGVKFATRLVEGVKLLDPASQIATLLASRPQWESAGTAAGNIVGKQLVLAMEAQLERAVATGDFAGPGGRFGIRSLTIPTRPGLKGFTGGDKGVADALTGKPNFNVDKMAAREFFLDPLKDLLKEGGKPAAAKADTARIAAEAVALLGALQSGGVGGTLSATGGLLGSIKGVPGPLGIGLTALGGVFSLFDHGQERRHREELDELRRIRENTDKRGQPDRTSFTFILNGKEISGAILQDVIYGYTRAARTNNLPVLPPS